MKAVAVLGSTGSIGQNTLDVIRQFPGEFRVVALSAHSNTKLLAQQIKEFKPLLVCVTDSRKANDIKRHLSGPTTLLAGFEGMAGLLADPRIAIVVVAISGANALLPLLWAIENRKDIALANKEALVMAGPLIRKKVLGAHVRLIPIDSEQSAIWQCLEGHDRAKLKTIYLTASGGPFLGWPTKKLAKITVKEALAHPRWKMGKKITVDSATLMNKGLEVLEAMYLFGLPVEKIKVIIHPESVVHSMVEFIDGAIIAQLSATDMRIPIQYAISYPHRLATNVRGIDFSKTGSLSFAVPDLKKFPCLALAFRAAQTAGTMPAVLNAANEISVEAFLNKKLPFLSIAKVVEKVMDRHTALPEPTLQAIAEADAWARTQAQETIGQIR